LVGRNTPPLERKGRDVPVRHPTAQTQTTLGTKAKPLVTHLASSFAALAVPL
jgi:hypothetical protein